MQYRRHPSLLAEKKWRNLPRTQGLAAIDTGIYDLSEGPILIGSRDMDFAARRARSSLSAVDRRIKDGFKEVLADILVANRAPG